jgi:hypothetical protein
MPALQASEEGGVWDRFRGAAPLADVCRPFRALRASGMGHAFTAAKVASLSVLPESELWDRVRSARGAANVIMLRIFKLPRGSLNMRNCLAPLADAAAPPERVRGCAPQGVM